MKKITLYSDGACSPNPGVGGYGAIMNKDGLSKKFSKGFRSTTNNRMELLGVIEPLESLNNSYEIIVVTDSQYVAHAITQKWIDGWIKRGWKTAAKKPVKNQDLWARMILMLNKHDITMQWVKGHNEHPENEECDNIAVEARQGELLSADEGYETDNDIPTIIFEKKKILDSKKTLKNCISGKHDLIIINSYDKGYASMAIIRWCKICGSVVVDKETDDKISPGWYRKMATPSLSKLIAKE